jgi:hypothetical protein
MCGQVGASKCNRTDCLNQVWCCGEREMREGKVAAISIASSLLKTAASDQGLPMVGAPPSHICAFSPPFICACVYLGVMYHRPEDAVKYLRNSLENVMDMPEKEDMEGCASVDGQASSLPPPSHQPSTYIPR